MTNRDDGLAAIAQERFIVSLSMELSGAMAVLGLRTSWIAVRPLPCCSLVRTTAAGVPD